MSEIIGHKSSGKSKTPTQAPDSLRSIAYFRILDLVGEGEYGGLVNGLQSVYLDQTPVANADGTLNFTNVHVEERKGTQDQDYVPGFSSIENEISVGVELRSDKQWVQALTDVELSGVRITLSVSGLQQQDTKTGDINGYTIQYAIDVSTDNGAYQTMLTSAFSGKTTSEYQRSHRIDLPVATTGWYVRVRRSTANANSSTIQDTTTVTSYTEIIDAKLRYPNSAIIGITGDASQFTNIPNRAYDLFGRIVQVPSTYDPTTRAYSGTWDGTLKPAWTNNPAWVYYDIIVNNRFGLGNLITAAQVDKWKLYEIAQYCDQLVDDGHGGQEPRFTCNAFLQTQQDAYKLLSDLASIFRGVSYWMAGAITPSADMPADPVYTYTQANVINGQFTYQSSARKTRYTTALVTWNDPSNFYNQAVEYVEHRDGLARYGIQQTELTAFGCTSQGQAHRLGQWTLLTSQLETDSVTFSVGLDGYLAAPGQIIRIADSARAGARQGGRISSATKSVVTVDRAPDECAPGDSLTVTLPTGVTETRAVASITGREITVSDEFSVAPEHESAWAVESSTLATQTYRVISVTEDSVDKGISFTISAVQHVAGKFANIDNGTAIQLAPISRLPASLQDPPTNVTITSHQVVQSGIANNVMTIAWTAANGAATYKVEWQKDSGQWIQAGTVSTTSVDVVGIYTGSYIARVTAYNVGNDASLPALSDATDVLGKTGLPPSLTSLTATPLVFGIQLAWGFPDGAEDTQRTEIWQCATNSLADATKLGDFAYPQNSQQILGLAAGVSLFFWGRLVDKTGNIGPWYPAVNGVNGQSSSDATQILGYLSNQISETELAQNLLSRINLIDGASALPGSVNARIATVQGSIGNVSTALSTETQQRTDADSALSSRIDTVSASTTSNASAITSESTARANADSALGTRIDSNVSATAAAAAAIQTEATTRANADSALATRTDGLYAQVTPKGAGDTTWGAGDTTVYAGTITVQSVAANDSLALSQRVDTITANLGTTNAAIQTETTARAAADQANASQITTLQASLGSTNALVQTNANAVTNINGKISASYNIKTQVASNGQTYIAGIAVGVDQSGGTVNSQVLVNANTFAVFDASASGAVGTAPFIITNNQVFLSQAFIADGTITNAKIGSTIQSTKLNSAGKPTWLIDKAGTITLNGDAFSIVHSSTGMVMTDTASGVKVVQLGVLS